MDSAVHIETRRRWQPSERLLLLGPGGVGKSTLGGALARMLGWSLLDLDLEFCAQLEVIGSFIAAYGYDSYRAHNLALAERLLAAAPPSTIFVTSSGFLAAAPGTEDRCRADRLVATGYGITLLPSLDLDVAIPIVVQRQLMRGFGFERQSETQKFRERFAIYRGTGGMVVASVAPTEQIAAAVITTIGLGAAA
jgi:shikimate kinase